MEVAEGGLALDLGGGGRRVVGCHARIRRRPGRIRCLWQRWSRGRRGVTDNHSSPFELPPFQDGQALDPRLPCVDPLPPWPDPALVVAGARASGLDVVRWVSGEAVRRVARQCAG
jgi:hypothetical protein